MLIAAVVGLALMFVPENDLTYSNTWICACVLLEVFVGVASPYYLVHLHTEIVETRRLMRMADNLSGVDELRQRITNRSYEESDHTRGASLLVAMHAAIAIASGAAVACLTKVAWSGWAVGGASFLIGSTRLSYVVCINRPPADA